MKNTLIILSFLFSQLSFGFAPGGAPQKVKVTYHAYYGSDITRILTLKDKKKIKTEFQKIFTSAHIKKNNAPDLIMENCTTYSENSEPRIQYNFDEDNFKFSIIEPNTCYRHKKLGYDLARNYLYNLLDNNNTNKTITDVYCRYKYSFEELGMSHFNRPNGNMINCEHTWPQSKFIPKKDETQKSDLHHLFSTDNPANSFRGNDNFGDMELAQIKEATVPKDDCSELKKFTVNGKVYIQVPKEHRGNVARAIFYFALRYNMEMDAFELKSLLKWNKVDPVDEAEKKRNDTIYNLQGTRNPYIDLPSLAQSLI